QQGGDQAFMFFGAFVCKLLTHHQDLVWMPWLKLRTNSNSYPSTLLNRHGVPRFTYTKTVQMTCNEVAVHLTRRHNDDPDITIGINTSGTEPLSEQKVVRRKGVNYSKSKAFSPARIPNKSTQAGGI